MARKERNDIDYFPHSVTHGKKMFYLRSKYGNDGYAVWFMLLENLGKASYHYLDLSDEIELMYLSSELKVSDIVLKEIIEALVKLGEFDKELWEENQVLFNEKFTDNISDAYKKRNNNCIDKKSLITLLEAKGVRKPLKSIPKPLKSSLKGVDNTQSKLKDSKLKDSKLKDNILGRKLTFSQSTSKLFDCEYPNDKHHLHDFVEYWTEHGDNDKKMRFEKQKSFSTTRRVKTWIKNNFNNINHGTREQNKQTAISIGLSNPNL